MLIDNLSIIGVGLIGGSLARALRKAKLVGRVIGCNRSEKTLKKAVEFWDVVAQYINICQKKLSLTHSNSLTKMVFFVDKNKN